MNDQRKYILYGALVALGFSTGQTPQRTPPFMEQLIKQTLSQPVWSPPAKIYRYAYKGRTVYYLSARCCDIPSSLYDENGQILCLPLGGFTGNGDGKCTDFFTARTEEKLIWQDTRKLPKK